MLVSHHILHIVKDAFKSIYQSLGRDQMLRATDRKERGRERWERRERTIDDSGMEYIGMEHMGYIRS